MKPTFELGDSEQFKIVHYYHDCDSAGQNPAQALLFFIII